MVQQVLANPGEARALLRQHLGQRGRPAQHAEKAAFSREQEVGALGPKRWVGGKGERDGRIDLAAVGLTRQTFHGRTAARHCERDMSQDSGHLGPGIKADGQHARRALVAIELSGQLLRGCIVIEAVVAPAADRQSCRGWQRVGGLSMGQIDEERGLEGQRDGCLGKRGARIRNERGRTGHGKWRLRA